MAGGGKGAQTNAPVNPFMQSSQAMQVAYNTVGGALNANALSNPANYTYQPAAAQAASAGNAALMNPATMARAATVNAAMADPATVARAANYSPAQQANAPTIASAINRYTNPYENQVVNRTTNNMLRALDTQQENIRADAAAAGAFGGSRHGLVESQTNAETMRNIGDITAQLRQQGFNTAAGLASQDVANTLGVNAQNQVAMNAARQFNAANQQNRLLANAGYAQQTALANQNSLNAARMYNATNQQNRLATNTANQQQAALANQAARNATNQFNAANRQQTALANQASRNAAGQFNSAQRLQADQSRFNNALAGAGMLGNLGQTSFNLGSSLASQQMQNGNLSQQLMQALLTNGQGMYDQYMNQPERLLQLRLASLGMNPLSNASTTTTNTSNNPGKGGAVGNLLGAAGNAFQFSPIMF